MRILLHSCTITLLAAGPLAADTIVLNDGVSRITGELRSMNPSGTLELVSPLAEEPLIVKGDQVKKVSLSNSATANDLPTALITLTNGDKVRGEVQSLNKDSLTLMTQAAGEIQIEKPIIKSAQFGIHRTEQIYSGPNNLAEWTHDKSSRDRWSHKQGSLVSMGRASIYKDVGLPEKFVLNFSLKWRSERPPQYEIFFADPIDPEQMRPGSTRADRYAFTFNNYGIEIRRYSKKDKTVHTIAQLNRNPKLYPNNQVNVEIRVDREDGRLQLYINGEPEGDFLDPIPNIPTGKGIRIASESYRGSQLEISKIKVTSYNEKRSRHSTEGQGNPVKDSLISIDDDRWSGDLVSIEPSAGETIFKFQSSFREEPLEIPASDVSMVYFAKPDEENPFPTTFTIRLTNDWHLKATECNLDKDSLITEHPLLGRLDIKRSHIMSIEASAKTTPTKK